MHNLHSKRNLVFKKGLMFTGGSISQGDTYLN